MERAAEEGNADTGCNKGTAAEMLFSWLRTS